MNTTISKLISKRNKILKKKNINKNEETDHINSISILINKKEKMD